MPDEVVCPIPVGLSHDDARAMFDKVRKEMPELTPAAHRREAARRMNVDYDTFLAAWKKAKATTKPVVPPPVVVPDPPIKVPDLKPIDPAPTPSVPTLTYDTARAQHKLVKKEMPHLSDAEARREAARRMNVDYDTYLRTWKKPKSDAPAPPPSVSPQTPTVTPQTTKAVSVKHDVMSVRKYLQSRGHKMSTKTKERLTHSGKSYGGGISETQGLLIDQSGESIMVRYRAGYSSVDEAKRYMVRLRKELEDAGLVIEEGTTKTMLIIRKPPTRTYKDVDLPWKRKEVAGPVQKPKFEYRQVSGDSRVVDFVVDGRQVARLVNKHVGAGKDRWYVQFGGMDNAGIEAIITSSRSGLKSLADVEKAYFKGISDGLPDHMMVNPGRRLGVRGTQKNCTSCTSSYELRRRGFDVRAVKMPEGKMLADVYKAWGIGKEQQVFSNAIDYWPSSISQSTWLANAASLPNGARGFISVNWTRGGAHIFNWEVRNGKVWYIDAQVGTETTSSAVLGKAMDQINVARVDELELSPDEMGWLTSDKEGQVPLDRKAAPSWVRL